MSNSIQIPTHQDYHAARLLIYHRRSSSMPGHRIEHFTICSNSRARHYALTNAGFLYTQKNCTYQSHTHCFFSLNDLFLANNTKFCFYFNLITTEIPSSDILCSSVFIFNFFVNFSLFLLLYLTVNLIKYKQELAWDKLKKSNACFCYSRNMYFTLWKVSSQSVACLVETFSAVIRCSSCRSSSGSE